ncbi:hypothetical protein CY35_11G086400 [Sphagnum magellanicum]|nr:hypothetical protein CY35_11G086400 [Sphagnum magellanicum]
MADRTGSLDRRQLVVNSSPDRGGPISPLDRRAPAAGNRMQEVVNSVSGRRTMMPSNPSHAGQTNSSTPCAACKLLRRRCAQECPFSPYFSPHEPQKFACVHKIFGASNVSKMLMEVPESQRADTASSLVYEANARIRDPVYGCMGAISALQQQAQSLQAELNAVRQEIMRYRRYDNAAAVGAAAASPLTAGAAVMALGYNQAAHQLQDHERGMVSAGALSSQTTASDNYSAIPSPNSVATPEMKPERSYWSPLN